MTTTINFFKPFSYSMILLFGVFLLNSCNNEPKQVVTEIEETVTINEEPDYFLLRPEIEKAYGYSHAVKIGNDIKISGAVSMDDEGNPTAVGDFEQQLKNCYADLAKVLAHYDCTFDDVVVENVFTTNMPLFLEHAAYRSTIYTKQFPTGSWLGVKELALPEFMIEIELEVHKSN
jgi:enamine deaminase RidA (YjgF/YER057c/UK114 family)